MAIESPRWLLLPGTPLTPSVWDGVRAELATHGEVVTPEINPPAGDVDADLQLRLAADVVETAATDAPWHVVGHSFGGQVALEFALMRPDLVSHLTLLCTRDTPFPAFGAAAAAVNAGTVDVDATLRRWFSSAEVLDDGPVVRYARHAVTTADKASWASALRAIASFDCSQRTASIACPVNVVAAEHDTVSDVDAMEAMHRRIPGSDFAVLDDAWHMSIFEDPVELARLLRR
ncbi:alpha/beta fold hydrolase [Gordonia sp. 'Campus']|uniref:alpha/beta fold hydrolase n=1 Tax=Gordonia sp. 'Campus' TaxID=2915824 RepID=UPI001EE3BEC2|nr:alpha/beta hydrolase [Gordonia sp. 'Campus']